MNKSEFDKAFREVVSMEFGDIPRHDNEIDYTFSISFENRMCKLIRKEKGTFWRLINSSRKRIAIIIAAIMILFTTACSVDAIREPIVNFIIEITEKFYDFVYDGETADTIFHEYQLSPIPDGFEEASVEITDTSVIRRYIDSSDNKIILSQNISDGTTVGVDSEKGTITTVTVNNIETVIYEYDNFTQAIWTSDSYVFFLIYYGDIEIDALQNLISTVK